MKCPVCNKINKIDSAICIHCGAKLPLEVYISENDRNTIGKYKMSFNKKLVIFVISILSIFAIILILILIIPKSEPKISSGIIINQQEQRNEQSNIIRNEINNINNSQTIQNINNFKIAITKYYRVRIREKPDNNSKIIEHLPKDTKVIILSKSQISQLRTGNTISKGYWYKIKWKKIIENNKTQTIEGWVWGDLLIFDTN